MGFRSPAAKRIRFLPYEQMRNNRVIGLHNQNTDVHNGSIPLSRPINRTQPIPGYLYELVALERDTNEQIKDSYKRSIELCMQNQFVILNALQMLNKEEIARVDEQLAELNNQLKENQNKVGEKITSEITFPKCYASEINSSEESKNHLIEDHLGETLWKQSVKTLDVVGMLDKDWERESVLLNPLPDGQFIKTLDEFQALEEMLRDESYYALVLSRLKRSPALTFDKFRMNWMVGRLISENVLALFNRTGGWQLKKIPFCNTYIYKCILEASISHPVQQVTEKDVWEMIGKILIQAHCNVKRKAKQQMKREVQQ